MVDTPNLLSLDMTVSNPSPQVGDIISYTISITNEGAAIETGVTIQDILPSNLSFVGATTAYSPNDELFTVNIPIDSGATQAFVVYAGVNRAGQIINTATLENATPAAQDPGYSVNAFAYAMCFTSGTRIRTSRGDIAVEALAVGDLAVTASGARRPIRWIGHRTGDCRNHPRAHDAMPIRIAAHAFGPGKPARDLLVSPGHSICVDVVGEVLIPAFALVNGSTIQQVEVDAVTYWHVELDSHDILLAENLACESYLAMGNRDFFAESGVVALDASPDAPVPTHADFCRPFHQDGPLVEVVRAQLSARARDLGWRLEAQGLDGLHLLVDGVRVTPQVRGFVARFAVAAEARDVWLVAPTSVPATVVDSPDLRALGACLTGLDLDDGFGASQTIAVDDPQLCVGFHAVERDIATTWRWTAGRARMPANLWADREGDFFLRVNLAGPMLPRWVEPAATMRNVTPMALAG